MSIMLRTLPLALLALVLPAPATPATVVPANGPETAPSSAFFEALRAADLRLATIAYRLTSANAALCDRLQPQIGMPIHALTQYAPGARPGAVDVFGFERTVAVEAVVPGAPAAMAGVRAGDSLAAIAGMTQPPMPSAGAAEGPADRDAAEAALAAAPIRRPVALDIVRGGKRMTIAVSGTPGCRSRFEILLGSGLEASADGAIVQVGERYFEGYSDAEIAVIVAHELAHNILRHRERLDAAKISRGITAELGRNGRLIRRTEDDADRLGVYLLANAGYDPQSAPDFWRQKGGSIDGGLFRSRTHASSKARAAALDPIVRSIQAGSKRPIIPADLLATRNQPLD